MRLSTLLSNVGVCVCACARRANVEASLGVPLGRWLSVLLPEPQPVYAGVGRERGAPTNGGAEAAQADKEL